MNTDGSIRTDLIWVPDALVPHVMEELKKNRIISLDEMPVPVKGRKHVRVPAGLREGIESQIAMWREAVSRKGGR